MSADIPFTPPRKKISILWWLFGFFVLLIFIFVIQLFGPNPRIIVSPQTTYITQPLRSNGLPDYKKYVLQLYRDGVSPQNNAATLIWKALWPGELDPPEYAAVAKELGWDQIPSGKDSLEPVYNQKHLQQIAERLRKQNSSNETSNSTGPVNVSESSGEDSSNSKALEEAADKIIGQAMSRPWTSEQIPPLAKWAGDNQKPLDLLVDGSRRRRCYFPSPSLLDNNHYWLIATLLPGPQSMRHAARSLSARGMWHLGEGRAEAAWQDVLAIHRISHLTTQGLTLVEQYIGIAISGTACEQTATLLDRGNLTATQARQVMRDLESIEDFSSIADSLDRMERLTFIDSVMHLSRERFTDFSGGRDPFAYLANFSVDWNVALREGNEFYDRYAAAARTQDGVMRRQQVAALNAEVHRLTADFGTGTLVSAVLSPSERSHAVAVVLISLMTPSLEAATTVQDRANATLQLTRLAAALAVYRAEHGSYPEDLDDLVPSVLEKLPVDFYNAKPYVYNRDGDGYLLYSTGENGNDDGGSNEQLRLFKGQDISDLDASEAEKLQSQIPSGADDIAIRVPRPVFSLPR